MVSPERQSDGDLVLAHLAGDPDAYSVLYERYFPGVHDFLTRLMRDRNEGADLTQDTFVKAIEQLPNLEDPVKFKSWLFAIAHRTALNRIRQSKRSRLDPGSVDDAERSTMAIADPDPTIDPEQMAASQEAADIVWEAAAGLDERTYTVMDLHVRQGLESAEIAEVLGVTTGNAYTMVSRMKTRFSDALGTYLLVRTARRGCPVLAGIVGEDVRELTPEIRRVADRHIASCDDCTANRIAYLDPVKIFAGLLAVPIPLGLKPAIWGTVAVGAGGAAAAGAGAASSAGAGAAGGATGSGGAAAGGFAAAVAAVGPMGLIVAAAALAAVVGVGGFLAISGGDDTAPPGDAGGPPSAAADTGTVAPTEPTEPPGSTELPTTTAPDEPISSTTLPEATTTTVPETTATTSPAATTTTEAVVPPPATTTVPPPAPPVANDDTATVDEDGSVTIDVLTNDTGDGLDPASVAVTSDPASGSAAENPTGTVTYTPDPGRSGEDSFTYSVTGESGATSSATVTVTVIAVNDAPEVDPLALTVPEDTPEGEVVGAVSASDPDGDPLTFAGTGDGFAVEADGDVVVTGPLDAGATPTVTFTATADDGNGGTGEGDVTVTVTAVNEPPTIEPATFSGVLPVPGIVVGTVTASDPDGDPLTYAITAGNENGRFAIDDGGELSIAALVLPLARTVDLTIEVTDTGGLSASATITVNFILGGPGAVDGPALSYR
jgi:RNA polymerase sigma factor (sigma-70 family)